MKFNAFAFEIKDGVAHVTMNQPDRGNPIDLTFAHEFNEIATECTVNPAVRAVLIDANGRFFSVGGDLNSLASSREGLARFIPAATSDLHMAISRFARLNAPVIAAVHGMTAGGGVGLIASCDLVLASPDAKFYAAFAAIGISNDSSSSYFLPRRMGPRRTAQFFMLNETLSAQEAVDAGMINRVVPAEKLKEEAWALARKLAQGPTVAFGEMKNLLLSSLSEPLETQLEHESRAIARAARTEDAWNALQAIKDKRKPSFEGR